MLEFSTKWVPNKLLHKIIKYNYKFTKNIIFVYKLNIINLSMNSEELTKRYMKLYLSKGSIENEIFLLTKGIFGHHLDDMNIAIISYFAYVGGVNVSQLKQKDIQRVIEEQHKTYGLGDNDFFHRMQYVFNILSNVNSKMSKEVYDIVTTNEIGVSGFILRILNFNGLLITQLNIEKKSLNNKINNIINEKEICRSTQKYECNSRSINGLYFNEKIKLLKLLAEEISYKKMNEWFKENRFITGIKLGQLRKVKFKMFNSEETEKNIFAMIIDMINRINNIRNAVAHNDLIFNSKSTINKFSKDISYIIMISGSKDYKELKEELISIYNNETKNLTKKQNLNSLFKGLREIEV